LDLLKFLINVKLPVIKAFFFGIVQPLSCFSRFSDRKKEYKYTRAYRYPQILSMSKGEAAGSRVELLFMSLITTYYKLRELGITEVNGTITFVDTEFTMGGETMNSIASFDKGLQIYKNRIKY
jgi:hypothetical protein